MGLTAVRIFLIYLESRKPQTNVPVMIAVPQPAPGVRLCAQDSFPRWMYTIWIPIIMFELLVLLLSLSLAVKYHQSMRLMRENYAKPTDSLQYIMLRDSITFPFMYVIYRNTRLYVCLHDHKPRSSFSGLIICILNLISWIRFPVGSFLCHRW